MIDRLGTRLTWRGDLAPGHERRDGVLCIGGSTVVELAARYATPLLMLDGAVLEATIEELHAAAQPLGIEIAYAGKALLLTQLARVLERMPLSIDVCSLGELATAERAGIEAGRLTLHGCGKTEDELAAAAQGRVGRIVVDNLAELDALGAMASPAVPVKILLRVNTGIEARTHAFVQTGGERTKFGMSDDDLTAAVAIVARNRALNFVGLHSHIGSQIDDAAAFVANVHRLFAAAASCARAGLTVRELIVGGGFAVEVRPGGESPLDIPAVLRAIAQAAREQAAHFNLPLPRLGIEPGRAIIAAAGTSLYRVMAKKRQGEQLFVVVDGGIADNPRPALYDAYHHAVLASRSSDAPLENAVVCGRSCENDRLTQGPLPGDVAVGDLLALCTTGAYTYSMASNYNRFVRPAVAYVKEGQPMLMARRETIDDVLRNDVDA